MSSRDARNDLTPEQYDFVTRFQPIEVPLTPEEAKSLALNVRKKLLYNNFDYVKREMHNAIRSNATTGKLTASITRKYSNINIIKLEELLVEEFKDFKDVVFNYDNSSYVLSLSW